MQTRSDDATVVSVSDYADAKNILLIGLTGAGPRILKEDLMKAPIISNGSEYKSIKLKKTNTIQVVEFKEEDVDDVTTQAIYLHLQEYNFSIPTLVVFCLDSSRSVVLQRAMIETTIILLNNRRFTGNYLVVNDVNKQNRSRSHVSSSVKESIIDLAHANFLSGNKVLLTENYDRYSKGFQRINDIVNELIRTLLQPETYANVSKYRDPIETGPEFDKFVKLFQTDFASSGLFKRSKFKKSIEKNEITTMEQVKNYAANHPSSRTAFLVKCHPEHSTDISFIRFLNRYEHAYQSGSGMFKRSPFKMAVAKGEIKSMNDVKVYVEANPNSRAASVTKRFNK